MLTDIGRSRSRNEDACALSPEIGAFVVCDGMGGAAAGEVASRLAASTFLTHLGSPAPANIKPQTRLQTAIHAANAVVHKHSIEIPDQAGMGTTLVALLYIPPLLPPPLQVPHSVPRSPKPRSVTPPDLFLANVGDSRCYRLRTGALQQLSHDHSFVEEQLQAGQITADEAAVSPMRNYITRSVGPHTRIQPDTDSFRTEPGDVYLLCTDGLTRELDDESLADILCRELPARPPAQSDLDRACATLIEAANLHGGRDNITVLLLAVL
jgi:serine/threonine protein phosphatase PrpC